MRDEHLKINCLTNLHFVLKIFHHLSSENRQKKHFILKISHHLSSKNWLKKHEKTITKYYLKLFLLITPSYFFVFKQVCSMNLIVYWYRPFLFETYVFEVRTLQSLLQCLFLKLTQVPLPYLNLWRNPEINQYYFVQIVNLITL